MSGSTTLSVIVPVYNEQYLVRESLSRLRVLGESPLLRRVKVIVVDDHSSDQTPITLQRFQEACEENFARGKFEWLFLRHNRNRGKGASIQTGLQHADTELVVIHDADLEYHPRDLLKMLPLFLEEEADVVFGSRFFAGEFKRALLFWHTLGNSLLTFLCDLVCDLNLTDMETCYKMVRTDLLKSIPLESQDFCIEPELTIKLAKRGARIFEVPISYSGRTYQEGKKIGWKDGLLAIGAIVKYAISDNLYTADMYGSQILARLNRAPRFTRWMADTVKPYLGQQVLEIGAGIGNITVHLTPRLAYWATDVNSLYLENLRQLTLTRPYLRVARMDITDPDSFPTAYSFDTVICLNVIEHIKDDVTALRHMRSLLEVGGHAIILVPQGPNLYGSLDRVLGHYRRYTKEQFIAVAQAAGFEVQEVLEFNRTGVLGWWLNGRVLQRMTFGLAQIKLLNLLVPLFRKLEPWLKLPALSLIGILEKVK
jgi:SAM-dependent methyltransferase